MKWPGFGGVQSRGTGWGLNPQFYVGERWVSTGQQYTEIKWHEWTEPQGQLQAAWMWFKLSIALLSSCRSGGCLTGIMIKITGELKYPFFHLDLFDRTYPKLYIYGYILCCLRCFVAPKVWAIIICLQVIHNNLGVPIKFCPKKNTTFGGGKKKIWYAC